MTCRSELLREWKRQEDHMATYAKLLRACVESFNAEAANSIIQLINGELSY